MSKSILEQIKEQEKDQLEKLIAYAGSASALALLIDTSAQVVSGWVSRGRISATAALKVEEFTNGKFKASEMRPDVKQWRNK